MAAVLFLVIFIGAFLISWPLFLVLAIGMVLFTIYNWFKELS